MKPIQVQPAPLAANMLQNANLTSMAPANYTSDQQKVHHVTFSIKNDKIHKKKGSTFSGFRWFIN